MSQGAGHRHGSAALPDLVRPMLAVPGDLPAGDGWGFEHKWDGMRCVAYVAGDRVRLRSRTDRDVTAGFPELAPLAEAVAPHRAVLDGEIVALDPGGRPSFGLLQPRLGLGDPARAARLAARAPVAYLLFDLLHLDGTSTMDRPCQERRRLLLGAKARLREQLKDHRLPDS